MQRHRIMCVCMCEYVCVCMDVSLYYIHCGAEGAMPQDNVRVCDRIRILNRMCI